MRSRLPDGPDGEALVLIGAAVAIQMAQGRSDLEIELLASFFEVLGDNLSLIAARRASAAVAAAYSDRSASTNTHPLATPKNDL